MTECIDTTLDFLTDTPAGKDADSFSPTLRPLTPDTGKQAAPSGPTLKLAPERHAFLAHRSRQGVHHLASDVITTNLVGRAARAISQITESQRPDDLGSTMGSSMLFPGIKIDGHATIKGFADFAPDRRRFDLTLECIRRHYSGTDSPFASVVGRYEDFFEHFETFEDCADFWLQDHIGADGRFVWFLPTFEDFTTPAVPKTVDDYLSSIRASSNFIRARHQSTQAWAPMRQRDELTTDRVLTLFDPDRESRVVVMATKVKEQSIAVFGESGSGKTVLLSSFYGATQEPSFVSESLYRLVADDTGQGTRLRQNYLRMRNQGQAPETNRFTAIPYAFTLKSRDGHDAKSAKAKPFNALRLVWHDYPGEWFEEEPSSDEESTRRVETFTKLLKSDVALVLVDGQKLLDYAGEEEKYLKSMLWGLRGGLEKLKDDILTDGKPLAEFPRIWILALSKADLHPTLDVHGFQDLVVEKAAGDLAALHETLKGFVQVPEAMSMGEDFMLLSSAKFEPGRIEVTERVGLDLILPVALMLPLERVAQWADRFDIPLKALGGLVDHAEAFSAVLTGAGAKVLTKVLAKVPKVGPILGPVAVPALAEAVKLGSSKLQEIHARAISDRDYLTATLTKFRLDLEHGVKDHLLVMSPW